MSKKLYKSKIDRKIFGVCGGIAEYFRVDSTIIRLIFVVLALGAMSGVLIYLLAALIMPEEPYYEDKTKE